MDEIVLHIDGEYPITILGVVNGDTVMNLYVGIEIKGVDIGLTDLLTKRQEEHFEARLIEHAKDQAEAS